MEIKNLRILESFERSTNFKVEVNEDPKIERLEMSGIKKFEYLWDALPSLRKDIGSKNFFASGLF